MPGMGTEAGMPGGIPASRGAPLRLWRSTAVTSTVMALAAGAHLIGGGRLPGLPALLLLAALVHLPVVLLASRRLSLPTLIGVLGIGQWSLHHAFAWLSAARACASPGGAVGGQVHGVHVVVGACGPSTPAPHGGAMGAPMLAAHVLAILLTAVALARGEAALWMLLAWLVPLASLPRPVSITSRGPSQQAILALPLRRRRSNARAERLRGPPPSMLPMALPH